MKYVPGGMFGQFSGSQGNTTASRNKFGSYVRNRVMPADPATAKQLAQRTLIQGFSNDWRALTQLQRDGWISLGDQMVRTNSLGQDYTLTGVQAFTSINMNLATVGAVSVVSAPALNLLTDIIGITLTATTGIQTLEVPFTNTITAGDFMVLDLTAGISAGINFVARSGFKLVDVVDSVDVSPQDVLALWNAIFGSLINDTKIFVAARMINADGFAGARVETDTIVVT